MKNKIKPLFIALSLVTAIGVNAQVNVEHYTSRIFDCAIFPAAYPTDLDGKPLSPSHSDVDSACSHLQRELKDVKCDNKDDMAEIVRNLYKYKIQVFGYTHEGDNILFLNCFRNDKDKDKEIAATWLTDIIQVEDGGDYFWSIKYDVNKGQLFDFTESGNN